MPASKKPKPARKVATKKPRAAARAAPDERRQLAERIAGALGIGVAEAELRALRELAERVAPMKPAHPEPEHVAQAAPKSAGQKSSGPLPERLYLLLDGRGLDGRGLPVEVIDVPSVVGSGRQCNVWINSPRIETRHLWIGKDESGAWMVEDLGSAHGTFMGGKPVSRRLLEDGDEFLLANYLRMRIELR
jgi:hypothetical protein